MGTQSCLQTHTPSLTLMPFPLLCLLSCLAPYPTKKEKGKKHWAKTKQVRQDIPPGLSGLLTERSGIQGPVGQALFLVCSSTWGSLPEWASVGN